jgi:hypothetical protein
MAMGITGMCTRGTDKQPSTVIFSALTKRLIYIIPSTSADVLYACTARESVEHHIDNTGCSLFFFRPLLILCELFAVCRIDSSFVHVISLLLLCLLLASCPSAAKCSRGVGYKSGREKNPGWHIRWSLFIPARSGCDQTRDWWWASCFLLFENEKEKKKRKKEKTSPVRPWF